MKPAADAGRQEGGRKAGVPSSPCSLSLGNVSGRGGAHAALLSAGPELLSAPAGREHARTGAGSGRARTELIVEK